MVQSIPAARSNEIVPAFRMRCLGLFLCSSMANKTPAVKAKAPRRHSEGLKLFWRGFDMRSFASQISKSVSLE